MWVLFYNWEVLGNQETYIHICINSITVILFPDFHILCYYLPLLYFEKKLYQFSCGIPFYLFVLLAIRYQPNIGRATYYNDSLFQKKKMHDWYIIKIDKEVCFTLVIYLVNIVMVPGTLQKTKWGNHAAHLDLAFDIRISGYLPNTDS